MMLSIFRSLDGYKIYFTLEIYSNIAKRTKTGHFYKHSLKDTVLRVFHKLNGLLRLFTFLIAINSVSIYSHPKTKA